MKGWGVGHKNSLFFLITWQWNIPNRIWDALPNQYLHSSPSWVNCQETFQISWAIFQTVWLEPAIFTVFYLHFYELYFHLHSLRCCQNTCKMHVVQILFGCFHKRFNIFDIVPSYQSMFDGNIQCLPRNLGV
jgi:hypothetical protein